jgi:hypothetical protein
MKEHWNEEICDNKRRHENGEDGNIYKIYKPLRLKGSDKVEKYNRKQST